MIILKELKKATFAYDPSFKSPFFITGGEQQKTANLTKVEMYSLARFIIRVSQHLSAKRKIKK